MRCNKENSNIILVKYEDIVQDGKNVLEQIFHQFDINSKLYDFNFLERAPVLGSSFLKDDNQLTWKPKEKQSDFRPTERSKDWGFLKNQLYAYYCKHIDSYFGYS